MKERDPYNAAEVICETCDMQYLYCICDEMEHVECPECEMPITHCGCDHG